MRGIAPERPERLGASYSERTETVRLRLAILEGGRAAVNGSRRPLARTPGPPIIPTRLRRARPRDGRLPPRETPSLAWTSARRGASRALPSRPADRGARFRPGAGPETFIMDRRSSLHTLTEDCPSAVPVLVHVQHVAEAARAPLARCVAESGCRLFAATDGPAGAYVIAGAPDDLGALRHRLVPIKGLDLVREDLEAALGEIAAPEGLPALHSDLYRKTEVAEELEVPPGTTMLVTKEFTFDAAHNLPRYNGKCERLHGHTFRMQVTLKAPLDPWSGMAFDFNDLKTRVQERVVKILDHAYINEVVPNPSAEYIAFWSWRRLADLPLHEIKIWETPTSHVTYRGPDPD